VSLYLVRHAKAGSRGDWSEADNDRPLSKNGRRQAEAIAKRLAKKSPAALLTSPFLRCRQTLEPLARLTDLDIVTDGRLAEGEPFVPVIDLLVAAVDGTVLCSHGDIVPDTITALQRRGCEILSPADWRKATVWTIERTGDEFTSARVWIPADS
jgi:8-oxo-dGTP diphosphatase